MSSIEEEGLRATMVGVAPSGEIPAGIRHAVSSDAGGVFLLTGCRPNSPA